MVRSPALLSTLLLLAVSSQAGLAWANMAPRHVEGDPIAEPVPLLRDVHIVHEDLRIDLRPLEDGGDAIIRARYFVRNDGAQRRLELFFVAPGLRTGWVHHGGDMVPAEPTKREVPELARPDGEPARPDGLSFALDLVPGPQEIRVKYRARAGVVLTDMVRSYVVDYALAPARRWASFGTLRIELMVPDGWDVLETPAQLESAESGRGGIAIEPLGQELEPLDDPPRVEWLVRGLPVDTLRIHVTPTVPYHGLLRALMIALPIAGLLLPIVLAAWLRARPRSPWYWLASVAGSVVMLALLILWIPSLLASAWIPDVHRSPPSAYPPGPYLAFALLMLGALIVAVAHAAALLTRRRGPRTAVE